MTDNSTSPVRTRGSFRVWANLSLRYKLILLFLTVTLLSVGTIAFLNVRSTSAAITAQANENVTALAISEARNIGTLLAKRVNTMQAFALHEHTQEGVAAQNGAYSGGTETILSELAKLDEQWVAAGDDDAFVQGRLNSELAHELKNVKSVVPDFAEIFLTDRYGGLVATSDRTSDYYQADEEWWQAAYNDGNGAVFIALPELDESTGVIGIDMAVPIYDQSNEIIGIMRTTLNVTTLIDRLAEVEVGKTGEAHLLLEGEVFVGPGGEPESFDDPTALVQVETSPAGAIATSYDGRPSVVGYATISSPAGEQFLSDLGWKVFIHQDQEEALVAVRQETRNTGLLALLIAGVAVVAAVVMGRALANPVVNLTDAVTRFTAGDMDARARSKSSDEIGTLATSFNTMAEQVGDLLTTVQARSAELEERTSELEASQRVTFAASEHISPDEMLGLVVDLVRDQFDLYHAQVYIVDEEKQAAVLRQSTGYAGSQLLEQGHQIPLDAAALVTRAIHSGEPVLVDDVNQAEDWLPNPLLPETQSELVVPLKAGGKVIGVLDAQAMTPGRFSESTVALFQTMADQITFLFENNELLERVTEQSETLTVFTTQLRTVAEIARQAGAVLDPEQLLQQVVELMQSRLGLYHAHIYVLDKATGQLNIRAGSGEVGRVLIEEGHAIPLDREKSLVARAARKHEPVLAADTAIEPDFMPNPLLPQTRAELAVPLVAGGETLGVLDMQDNQVGRFTETDVDAYSTLAGQIATALQNADLFTAQQAAEERFRSIVEHSQSGILILDDAYHMIYVNDELCQIVGYPQEELIGMDFRGLLNEESLQLVADHYVRRQRGEEVPSRYEFVIVRKDGEKRDCEISSALFRDSAGNVRSVGQLMDITERKQAEEELRAERDFSTTLVQASPAFLVTISGDGKTLMMNDSMLQALGYTLEEIEGADYISTFVPERDREALGDVFAHLTELREPTLNENYILTKDGREMLVEWHGRPILKPNGEFDYFFGLGMDITARKQAEAERERFTLQLGTASDIAAQVNAILDPDELLNQVIPLLKERFGLYYVHVYTLEGDTLKLRAGYGEPGRKMLEQGHSIPLDREASLVARAARSKEPVLVNDVSQDPNFLPNPLLPDTKSEVAVPLVVGEQVLGVFDVQHDKVDYFTQADLDVFQTLAGQIGTALQNAGYVEQVETRLKVSRALADAQTEDEVLDVLIQQMGLYPNTRASIFTVVPEAEELTIAVRRQAAPESERLALLEDGMRLPLSQFPSLRDSVEGKTSISSNLLTDENVDPAVREIARRTGARSQLSLPLMAGGEYMGVISVSSPEEGYFDERKLNLYQTVAEQGATALRTAHLYEETQKAAERVHEADMRKSEFLADMSHELRTPLNSIIGYAELMLMGVSEIDPDTLEDVQAIYDNGQFLLRIINNLLDLAKIEAGRMELEMEQVNVPALLEEIKTGNLGLLVDKPVEMLIQAEDDLPPVEADRVRLSQILNNLVGNAIKFTEEGSITMRASADDGWVRIEVKDTGSGMSEDDLQKIFERFKQGSSLTRRAEGTGLGLDITRHLVEMHGGTIDVHSTPGEGSTFVVRLPVRQVGSME